MKSKICSKLRHTKRNPISSCDFLPTVPQVLQKCAEFIEQYGIVDGIYRLSGVTSNIQRLRYSRQEKDV
uniref:Rho-GAP domain-containing protein n=1 Tax=Poecilia latipinna TaxID=48699 RepID=A0A3B3TXC6_9TELE